MTFRVNAQGQASVVVDPIVVDRAVALDSVCSISVTVIGSGKLKPGTYTLLSAPSFTGGETIVANVVNGMGRTLPKCEIRKDGNAINLVVMPRGLVIAVQ